MPPILDLVDDRLVRRSPRPIDSQIVENPTEPCLQRGVATVLVGAFQGPDEGFMDEVTCQDPVVG